MSHPPESGTDNKSVAVHACPTCSKAFSRSVNRDRHLATHNKVPSHVCSICQRRFHRADVLAKHVIRHRLNATPGPVRVTSKRLHTASDPLVLRSDAQTVRATPKQQPSTRSLAASRKVARACFRCNKAKARCDGQVPACSRCLRLDDSMICSYQFASNDVAGALTLAEPDNNEPAEAGDASSLGAYLDSATRPAYNQPLSAQSLALNPSILLDNHGGGPIETPYADAWLHPQAAISNVAGPGCPAPPLDLEWLLQDDDAPIDWTAYLGDPGMQLRADVFDLSNLSTSRSDHDTRPESCALQNQIEHQSSSAVDASISSSAHIPGDPSSAALSASASRLDPDDGATPRAPHSPAARAQFDASPAAASDAAAEAAATLARIRSAAVHRGYLRSATPSEDGHSSSQSSGDEKQASDAQAALKISRLSRKSRSKRPRIASNADIQSLNSQTASQRMQGSSSDFSDLGPLERADRDVAVQSPKQRVTYRQPGQSAHRHLQNDPAAPSPEDLARQEAVLERMVQSGQGIGLAQGNSPGASSERLNKRRRRRNECWPSVYRPKATDGGRHLSLDKVPYASAEVTALENSYQVAPMTDLAKERMIDEFRFCEVEARDLQRIQNTLRSIETSTLNLFLQLYFEHHDPVLPILNRGAFDPDACDPLLLAAVTCLGALCSKAENAFAYSLLTSSLVHAVSYKLIGINHLRGRYLPSMQTLLLTYALWRNLGDPAKLEYVEGFRNIVLTMARRCRLFELQPFPSDADVMAQSDTADPQATTAEQEEVWSRWIRHQEMVRCSWALFVLDSDLSLAWDLPCTITIGELRSPLPCPESLWQAESASEWSKLRGERTTDAGCQFLSQLLSMDASQRAADTVSAPHSRTDGTERIQARLQHTSPLARLVLGSAVHNVALSRWNTECVLTHLFDSQGNEDDDVADRATMVPRKDPEFEMWVDFASERLNTLSSSQMEPSSRSDAQLLLYGARLRMLVSFNNVQIMSGRKGYRRSNLRTSQWLEGPLRQDQYRQDIFKVASKIFTVSLAARGDASTSSGRTNVSGTGAENSILFYATVCLALLCQYLVKDQGASHKQALTTSSSGRVNALASPDAGHAPKTNSKMRSKDVYFLPGVGALTNPMSLDRLVHVAVHQGLNHGSWPLGHILGKVLQEWARTLPR